MSRNFRERFRFKSYKMTAKGIHSLKLNNSIQVSDLRESYSGVQPLNLKLKKPSRIPLNLEQGFRKKHFPELTPMMNHSYVRTDNSSLRDASPMTTDQTPVMQSSSNSKKLPHLHMKSSSQQMLKKYTYADKRVKRNLGEWASNYFVKQKLTQVKQKLMSLDYRYNLKG